MFYSVKNAERGRRPPLAETMIVNRPGTEKFRQGIRLHAVTMNASLTNRNACPTARLQFLVASSASVTSSPAPTVEHFGIALAMLCGGRERQETDRSRRWADSNSASAIAWKRENRWSRFINNSTPHLPKRKAASLTVILGEEAPREKRLLCAGDWRLNLLLEKIFMGRFFTGVLGMAVIWGSRWLFSPRPARLKLKTIAWGLGLQWR